MRLRGGVLGHPGLRRVLFHFRKPPGQVGLKISLSSAGSGSGRHGSAGRRPRGGASTAAMGQNEACNSSLTHRPSLRSSLTPAMCSLIKAGRHSG